MIGRIFMAVLVSLGLFTEGTAQSFPASSAGGGWGLLGILSIPQGSYAKSSEGMADMGFGAGIEFSLPLQGSDQLSLTTGAYYVHNPNDVKYLRQVMEGVFGEPVSMDANGWNHFTLLTGIRLTAPLQPGLGLYAQAQAGANIAVFGDIETRTQSYGTINQSSSPVVAFAFAVGAGVKAGRLNFGARYMNMGEPEITIKTRGGLGGDVETRASQEISMIALTAGFDF